MIGSDAEFCYILLIFCLIVLLIVERRILRYPLNLSVSPFISTSFWLTGFTAVLLLHTHLELLYLLSGLTRLSYVSLRLWSFSLPWSLLYMILIKLFLLFSVNLCNDLVSSHYLRIPYLLIYPLTKTYSYPKNQYLQYFRSNSWTCTEQQKVWVTWHTYSQLKSNKATLCLLVSTLKLKTKMLFTIYLVPHFSHFCAFCWWFHCLTWPWT